MTVYFMLICIQFLYFTIAHENPSNVHSTFYSYDVLSIEGSEVSLKFYKGKIALVVNVASHCGFTDGHYRDLVRLQNKLGSTGNFVVLAFPCNQFYEQEPNSNTEIYNAMQRKYSVNFPMFAKIDVLGSKVPQSWQYLIDKSGKTPNWNFWKYLVDQDGHVLNAWGPRVSVTEIYPEVFQAVQRITADGLPRQSDEL